jgi:hypothetical protein
LIIEEKKLLLLKYINAMKKYLLFLLLASGTLIVSSCSKKAVTPTPTTTSTTGGTTSSTTSGSTTGSTGSVVPNSFTIANASTNSSKFNYNVEMKAPDVKEAFYYAVVTGSNPVNSTSFSIHDAAVAVGKDTFDVTIDATISQTEKKFYSFDDPNAKYYATMGITFHQVSMAAATTSIVPDEPYKPITGSGNGITITSYTGASDGKISGTFNGAFAPASGSSSAVSISNGKFQTTKWTKIQ